jgi:putative ABC transport system permease protein
MISIDMLRLGFENLLRTKLRSVLTVLGVVIGIGALTAMVSFGTGMQRMVTEAFKKNDLFTSLVVSAGGMAEIQAPEDVTELMKNPPEPLTDSTVAAILAIPEVEIAFPEISFPVRLELEGHETRTTLRGLPAAMGAYKPFNDLLSGEFFSRDDERAAVVRLEVLEDMGFAVKGVGGGSSLDKPDSTVETTPVDPDSLIGKNITIISAVLDRSAIPSNPVTGMLFGGDFFQEAAGEVRITGILDRLSDFSSEGYRGGIFVPIVTADSIPRLGFSSVWDLLGRGRGSGKYASIYVRVGDVADLDTVRTTLTEAMGLSVFSLGDVLKDIRRGFLILDSVLAAVGTVALFVAALGIVNTMVMSILERTREIGIMKAIGASDTDISGVFLAEAAAIGVVGAVFGLILGWLVTRVANAVVNARLIPQGQEPVNLFYFPLWLILGAVGFSVLVSLLAGLYPAGRAARVDPVKALRHD